MSDLICIVRRGEQYQFSFKAHYTQSIDYLIESTKYIRTINLYRSIMISLMSVCYISQHIDHIAF